MAKMTECPHCGAPLKAQPHSAVLTCEYCGVQSKNTVYLPPKPRPRPAPQRMPLPTPPPPKRAARGARGALLMAIILIGVGVAVSTSMMKRAARRVTDALSQVGVSQPTSGVNQAAADDDTPADRQLGAKLAPYAACIERHSERAFDSRARYFSWVASERTGPTCGERHIRWGVYTVHDPADCERGIATVRLEAPRDAALEQAGDRYVVALKALSLLLRKADRYYDQRDYRDDGCALGRTLHPQLTAQWTALAQAHAEIVQTLDDKQTALLERRVARAAQRGGGLRHAFLGAVLGAKQMMRALRIAAEQPEADAPAARQAVDRFAAAVDALEAAATQRTEEASRTFWLRPFLGSAEALLKAAKIHLRGSAQGATTRRRRRAAERAYSQLVRANKQFIRYSSNVRFRSEN